MRVDLPQIQAQATIESTRPLFFAHNSHYFPVMNDGELVGVLRFRDVAKIEKTTNCLVADLMKGPVKTIDGSLNIKDALDIMIDEGIFAFVVTHDHHLLGTLAVDDLLKIFSTMLKKPDHSIEEHFCFLIDPHSTRYMVELINKIEAENFPLANYC